ncbi:formamidopyrimidine-DNA glycosylase [Thermaerobacter marianensis DSM 12885]|uniref:Formamidopyrimidine-DNA glycosylase n=1 Tax=Thermaerobacter marianensis (strain ATCC 700841 / DSM 12885 / JCM 10246 / 7p75a) TaxID=644966 RepID=E6SGJ8_THEM7|nr:bifunctional DNA-formamidopyrimidine glycosylase/DNA-(apurinic or apyrimidinic site) lyase [Thermaerobacter marianensis]ADU50544.1 formamidopyrimidine-DNA glycosylase [Thermaerobacter marianensis DSM 12885]
MPELPEVETVRRDLERHLEGAWIAGVRVLRPDVVVGATPPALERAIVGARFRRFARRGKYLLLELEEPAAGAAGGTALAAGRGAAGAAVGGASEVNAGVPGTPEPAGRGQPAGPARPATPRPPRCRWLVIHLRMTGRLTLARCGEPLLPHTHLILDVAGAAPWDQLRFSDPRRFGRVYLLSKSPFSRRAVSGRARDTADRETELRHREDALPEGLRTLGPEPLSRRFTAAELARRLAGRRAPVKSLLLDQRAVAGVGNIYADEALFRARIHPARPAGELSPAEVARLVRALRRVLREAVAAGGTTFSDYRDGLGREGRFARRLAAYGRQGEPCLRCGTPIATLRLGGRTAHFCPRCQPVRTGGDHGQT